MPYLRLDDAFTDHPKVDALSDPAFRLHVSGICYSARLLTDGKVPADRVARLVPQFKPKTLAELVTAGLWTLEGDSYDIHDYLRHNPSREHVLAERAAAAERSKRHRESRGDSRRTSRVTNGVSHASLSNPIPSSSYISHPPPVGGPPQATDEQKQEANRRTAEAARQGRIKGNQQGYRDTTLANLAAEGWKPELTPQSALPDAETLKERNAVADEDCAPIPEPLRRRHDVKEAS